MKTLVLGASGATGKHLVQQLLLRKQSIKIIVRPSANIPDDWINNQQLTIIRAEISAMPLDEIADHIKDCQAIASCLGHTMSFKGIFGKPRKLVTNTVGLFCSAIKTNPTDKMVKFVLMNSIGCSNKDQNESISQKQKIMMSIFRTLLPPHRDNEEAAEFLRSSIGQKTAKIQWVTVRPDNLTHEDAVTAYHTYSSPINTLFDPYKVSRINVAHFMASLLTEDDLWEEWKGKMPVIYNNSDL